MRRVIGDGQDGQDGEEKGKLAIEDDGEGVKLGS